MSFIKTFSGNKFYVNEPEKTKFDLGDIAHALSLLCRFGGHTMDFYSVAQHSILVSEIVEGLPGGTPDLALWGLMHDATEAYMIDIPTPLKVTLPGYEDREHALMKILVQAFELPAHGEEALLPRIVKDADRIALVTEARQLMSTGLKDWSEHYLKIVSFNTEIVPMSCGEAEDKFLARWCELQRQRGVSEK